MKPYDHAILAPAIRAALIQAQRRATREGKSMRIHLGRDPADPKFPGRVTERVTVRSVDEGPPAHLVDVEYFQEVAPGFEDGSLRE